MNTTSRMICLAALAVVSISVGAQDVPVPKKYENASPEIRAAMGLPPVKQEPEIAGMEVLRAFATANPAHCATVKDGAPVSFRGRVLQEIPDIRDPRLRLANQLMSYGCHKRSFEQLESVLRTDPENRDALYIRARLTWFKIGTDDAEKVLHLALSRYPDFQSAKVLLAGIRFKQNRLDESAAILAEVAPKSPTDAWVYLGRARIEGLRSPSAELRERMLEFARNPQFPPNEREAAADVAMSLPNLTMAQYEETLRAHVAIEHPINNAYYAANLAMFLGDSQQRFDDVVKLLESPQSKAGNYLRNPDNRTMLAQAYLMQAAKISAQPGPANQALIAKADRVVNGDYTSVALNAQPRPFYPTLKPFLDELVHPTEEDSYGETRLCRSIEQLNATQVRAALAAGADPQGRCRGESLVGSLVFMATVERDNDRREVMRALLEGGAPVTNIDACRSRSGGGDCWEVLLPLMEQYSRKSK